VLAVAFLGLMEVAQGVLRDGGLGQRTADWRDALANALGAAAFLALGSGVYRRTPRALAGGVLAAFVLLLPASVPTALVLSSAASAGDRVLSDFESARDLNRWDFSRARGRRVASDAPPGAHALRVDFRPRGWSCARCLHGPRDWRERRTLAVEATVLGDAPLDLHVKIADAWHRDEWSDRYNAVLRLAPGRHALRVSLSDVAAAPATRRMDMARVTWVEFFTEDLESERSVVFDDLRLLDE